MNKIEVFDPALCCSSGVCGPSPDQALTAFAGLVRSYAGQAQIRRYNLSQEPRVFAETIVVRDILRAEGPDALPIILIDGKLAMKGCYPTREQLDQLVSKSGGSNEKVSTSPSDGCCSNDNSSSCC